MVMALAGNKADLEERRIVSADVSLIFVQIFDSSTCELRYYQFVLCKAFKNVPCQFPFPPILH